jgi:hypothetical protein
VTAHNAERGYGDANPTFTYSVTGFVHGEMSNVLTGAPALTTTATAASALGPYAIAAAQGTLSDPNYTFVFVGGTLTVVKGTPVITWPAPAAISVGTAVGTVQQDAAANVPGTFVYMQPAGWKPIAGTHTMTVTFTPDDTTDYTITTASVTLTVTL